MVCLCEIIRERLLVPRLLGFVNIIIPSEIWEWLDELKARAPEQLAQMAAGKAMDYVKKNPKKCAAVGVATLKVVGTAVLPVGLGVVAGYAVDTVLGKLFD